MQGHILNLETKIRTEGMTYLLAIKVTFGILVFLYLCSFVEFCLSKFSVFLTSAGGGGAYRL